MWTSRHRTLDEYVDIPFVFTRLFVTCFGAMFVVWNVVTTCLWVASVWPNPHPPEINPIGEVLFLALAALPVYGMVLVWRRPRRGFLMSGAGLAIIVVAWRTLALLDRGMDGLIETFGWPQDSVVLAFLSWLAFAWWKVGPARPHEPFQGPF
jgi:hypothetical protein